MPRGKGLCGCEIVDVFVFCRNLSRGRGSFGEGRGLRAVVYVCIYVCVHVFVTK